MLSLFSDSRIVFAQNSFFRFIVYFAGVRPWCWQHYPRLPSCHHRAESFGPDTTLRRGWKLFHHWLRNDTHKECRKVSAVPIILTNRSNQYIYFMENMDQKYAATNAAALLLHSTICTRNFKRASIISFPAYVGIGMWALVFSVVHFANLQI